MPTASFASASPATAPNVVDSRVVAILDDDPTGTQEVVDTAVVLTWDEETLRRVGRRSFHVITNTRAHDHATAFELTRGAAAAIRTLHEEAQVVLRGDSTLRAHLRAEYEAVRDVVHPGTAPALLLVPALPAAGRVTVGGVHLLELDGRRVPTSDTEFSRDGAFSYRSSRLLDWAEERSEGLFAAGRGVEVPLARVRARGAEAVRAALAAAAGRGAPAVCVPDAESVDDLDAIAIGLRAALADGIPVVVRCAPTFAAVLTGNLAGELVAAPRAERLLVICGSYVTQTSRQLAQLELSRPGTLIELDLAGLTGAGRTRELARARRAAATLLTEKRLAVVATPRKRDRIADDPEAASLATDALAELTRLLHVDADVVVFKGGITAAVGVRAGLGAHFATVEGPVRPGVAMWRLEDGGRCLVFPGNVGSDNALAELCGEILT